MSDTPGIGNASPPQKPAQEASDITPDAYKLWLALIAGTLHLFPQVPVEQLRQHLAWVAMTGPIVDPYWHSNGANAVEDAKDLLAATEAIQRALARIAHRSRSSA